MGDNILSVGLGECKVSRISEEVIIAFGLGSCLGIGMYDPVLRIGGLLHAVLPENKDGKEPLSAKYVDSGIRYLLEQVTAAGAVRSRIIIRMAGGANMLTAPGLSNTFDIGTRNIQSARNTFKILGLKVLKEEVGGEIGRTVRLYISDGRMTIRMMGGKEREM